MRRTIYAVSMIVLLIIVITGMSVALSSENSAAPGIYKADFPPGLYNAIITTAQRQPAYSTPDGAIILDSEGQEVWLPADFSQDGYDTFIITHVQIVDERYWLGLFLGGENPGWVPLDMVTLLPLAGDVLDWSLPPAVFVNRLASSISLPREPLPDTSSISSTSTLVPTAIHTPTLTYTPSSTPTITLSPLPTNTPTNTATNTPSNTPTNTATNTPSNTPTDTPTNTPSNTPTDTPTNTATNTPSNTPES